jgi:hypothetical protein
MRRPGVWIVVLLAPIPVSARGVLSETPGRRLNARVLDEARRPVVGAAVNSRTNVSCGRWMDLHALEHEKLEVI